MTETTKIEHPWGHGADAVRGPTKRGEVFDCGHKATSSTDGPLRYGDDWVCLPCALKRCPVCSIEGRNVMLPPLDEAYDQLTIEWR